MPRRPTSPLGGSIIIPTDFSSPKCIIKITDDNGTVHTVADTSETANPPQNNWLIDNVSITRSISELGNFKFSLDNTDGRFLNVFDGGEDIEIYVDYSSASHLIIKGKIDNVSYSLSSFSGWTCSISGRVFPELNDRLVVLRVDSALIDAAVKDLIDKYFDDDELGTGNGLTFTYWENDAWTETPTTINPLNTISATYQYQSGWQTLKDLCEKADVDYFITYDSGWYIRVFDKESLVNSVESVSVSDNLLGCSDFGIDNSEVKNSIKVFGKTEGENILLLKSEKNDASISNLWRKDLIINESSITKVTEVQDKAIQELSKNLITYSSGRVNSVGLPTLNPGEMIKIIIPYCGVSGYNKIVGFTHSIGTNGFNTSLDVSKKVKNLSDLFKERIDFEQGITSYENLNDMEDSYPVYFDESGFVHTSTEIVQTEGSYILKLQSGENTGNCVSPPHTADYEPTSFEFRAYGDKKGTEKDTYEVSFDNGVSWTTISFGVQTTIATEKKGTKIKCRINLTTDGGTLNPYYESVCVLYKR